MLLVEYKVLDKLKVINEGTGASKKLRLRGKFQKCDEANNNGRVYPRKILENQVKEIQSKINERSLVGALDHPENDSIHLSQASHLITKLWVEDNGDVMGEAEILSTPNGKIIEALINDGVKIGISSRGLGTLSEGKDAKVVNEDFRLITFDIVSDPSTKGAFPELTESVKRNSEKAQKIVEKYRKDKMLLTLLESKIDSLLEGSVKKANKAKKKDWESGGFKDKMSSDFAKQRTRNSNLTPGHTSWNKSDMAEGKAKRSMKHDLARGKKTKGQFSESLTLAILEGLTKRMNKAKKNAHAEKKGEEYFKKGSDAYKKKPEKYYNHELKAGRHLARGTLESIVLEGLVKRANKAKKNAFEVNKGKSMDTAKANNTKSYFKKIARGTDKVDTHNANKERHENQRGKKNFGESLEKVTKDLKKLIESTESTKVKKAVKDYLLRNLNYVLSDSYPVDYEKNEKSYYSKDAKEKVAALKELLGVIESI